MQFYSESLTQYIRLPTKGVKIGDLLLGNHNPIRVQTMTTTDTMDTRATVEQSIRCIEAGAELIRITAPSKNEAQNLLQIKNELRRRGYQTPIVADIHFTPNAAEIAARIVEKVRVNPGNYVDKKKFELIEYNDHDYAEEIERIRDRFTPLVKICKEYGTAMRIGTNHGSLSDRIMSRYGDTPMGMVESAMEFLRIARGENYHEIVLSMKSSNPKVMVQAYRLLVKTMHDEWGEIYPLHLGVTEAGDGEDGRIKSAIGIGTLLEDGLGDTIRVSLTEDPEFEIPVCKDILKRYSQSPTAIYSIQSGAKAPSRREGGEEPDNILHEDTVGYRFADPSVYSLLKEFSLKHRSIPTQAEGVMWEMLKTKRLENFKFRRQHIIDRFITDFVCLKRKLVIEIDGLIHSLPENKLNDEERSLRLNTLGFKVIRFTNEQVLNDIETTLQVILSALKQQPELGTIPGLSSPIGGQGARESFSVDLIGGHHVPAVIADLSKIEKIAVEDLKEIGYYYNESLDKWTISDTAPDYIFTGVQLLPFALPGTLKVICYAKVFSNQNALEIDTSKYFPIFSAEEFVTSGYIHPAMNFVMLDSDSSTDKEHLDVFANDPTVVLCFSSTKKNAMQSVRSMFITLIDEEIKNPVLLITDSTWKTPDEHLVHYAIETGALLLDGYGDGICLGMNQEAYKDLHTDLFQQPFAPTEARSRAGAESFINSVAFGILQATRTRISKTEYISCPSCGRTLFDLQETTAKIRAVTHHLKGLKIAIMGCIVNGPGEMADADFGYVGSGPGKITLYKGKEVIKRNVPSEIAVVELVNLLKENGAWVEKEMLVSS